MNATGLKTVIRQARFPEEYPAIYALWQNAGDGIHLRRSDTPEEIAKIVQRNADLFLVAESDRRIVGAVLGGFDGRRGMVYHLAVAQLYRQHGIASALMEELESRLRAKGCVRCYLLVTRDNEEAMHFYERHNWKLMELHAYGKDLD